MPYKDVESFTFIENCEKGTEKSYEIIESLVSSGMLEKNGIEQPDNIVPMVMCEEKDWVEKFQEKEQFDLIINNMNLHWVNDIEGTLGNFHKTLLPDGAFISASLGGDTLQELRICMNLAQQEREGGISPLCSPFLSVTQLGNIFARMKYNLPTIDVSHVNMEFTSMFALLNFVSLMGE